MKLNFEDYFVCEKIKQSTEIWRWNLNNTPKDPAVRILILAELIKYCQNNGNLVKMRPDKRLRAKGLFALFSNNPPDISSSPSIKE